MRSLLAWSIGLVIGILMVLLFETLSHILYPVPPQLDLRDAVQFAQYLQQLPTAAYIWVFAGWFFAGVNACIFSAWLAPQRPVFHAAVICSLFLVLSAINLLMFAHPFWMMLLTPVIYIAAFFIGSGIGKRLHSRHHNTNSTASG